MKKGTILIPFVFFFFAATYLYAFQGGSNDSEKSTGITGREAHLSELKKYEDILASDPDSYDALISSGREMIYLGYISDMIDPDGKAEEWYSKVVDVGTNAVDIDSRSPHGHFLLAVSKARLGKYRGIRESIRFSKQIKVHTDTVLALDPKYYQANYLLGKWHQTIANVSWFQRQFVKIIFGGLPKASNEKAIEHYKKEIEYHPEYIIAYKELGGLYKDIKKWDLAKEYLEKCISLPDNEEFDHIYKAQARELLKQVSKKTGK